MKSEFRNWSDIRVFLAVVREGSTLAASHKLGMAQLTVARRIEALEHATGLTLFERDNRGFKPTKNGRELVKLAVSLGATESLAEHPATMTHADVVPEDQQRLGITSGMVRLSVGVEHFEDILADLEQALAQV